MRHALTTVANWIWNKITNIDYAMIAAAFVEVPRWAVAFAAIREPMWAAVPMGLLLAWAASAGWKAYFEDKSRVLLLIINSASLVGALIVIAPVLYAMTYMPLDSIDLSQVLPPEYLWVWAIVLSITTFVPLVQVAAVKAYHAKSATAADAPQPAQQPAAPDVAQPAPDAPHPVPPAQPAPQPATPKPAPVLRKVSKPGKTNEFGMTDTALAELLGVARQRIEPMRKSGTLMARVARDLPQLAVPHTNGFNHDVQ